MYSLHVHLYSPHTRLWVHYTNKTYNPYAVVSRSELISFYVIFPYLSVPGYHNTANDYLNQVGTSCTRKVHRENSARTTTGSTVFNYNVLDSLSLFCFCIINTCTVQAGYVILMHEQGSKPKHFQFTSMFYALDNVSQLVTIAVKHRVLLTRVGRCCCDGQRI